MAMSFKPEDYLEQKDWSVSTVESLSTLTLTHIHIHQSAQRYKFNQINTGRPS